MRDDLAAFAIQHRLQQQVDYLDGLAIVPLLDAAIQERTLNGRI